MRAARPATSLAFVQRFTIWLNARLLPIWVYGRNLEQVLRFFHVSEHSGFLGTKPKPLCNHIIAATKKPWFMRDRRCLRQGLLGMKFLRMAGYDPVLKFGVDAGSVSSANLKAHCWIELDGKPILNDSMENMVVIFET